MQYFLFSFFWLYKFFSGLISKLKSSYHSDFSSLGFIALCYKQKYWTSNFPAIFPHLQINNWLVYFKTISIRTPKFYTVWVLNYWIYSSSFVFLIIRSLNRKMKIFNVLAFMAYCHLLNGKTLNPFTWFYILTMR